MPCSFFPSDRDGEALNAIRQAYDMMRAGDLHRCAFARGRASSEIVYFRRRDVGAACETISPESDAPDSPEAPGVQVHLVRGGMPVHVAARFRSPSGLPLVHTQGLADSSGFQFLVSPSHRGIVAGVAILSRVSESPGPSTLRSAKSHLLFNYPTVYSLFALSRRPTLPLFPLSRNETSEVCFAVGREPVHRIRPFRRCAITFASLAWNAASPQPGHFRRARRRTVTVLVSTSRNASPLRIPTLAQPGVRAGSLQRDNPVVELTR